MKRCKCGRMISFVKNEDGELVPLDMSAPVYEVSKDMFGEEFAQRFERAYVSHFSICRFADEFTNKGEKK